MEELTLEKFEEASELVKDVTTETKLVYSEYFLCPDRKQGVFQAGEHAVHGRL